MNANSESGVSSKNASFLDVTASVPSDLAEHLDDPAWPLIGNKLSNVNLWNFRTLALPERDEGADLTEFVEYLQFMQATGSAPGRELFLHPEDRSVLDDYDFAPLLEACRLTLALKARPHIKLSIPEKYAEEPLKSDFSTNASPLANEEAYYNFIVAMAEALVDRFGLEEVQKWRFGVLTEFENPGWFRTEDRSPEKTRDAYFRLYDYSVAALASVIGPDVFVGAHAMSCTEGLWDERELLDHCASGINAKTGEKGTRICFMAVSFYDFEVGKPNVLPLEEVVDRIRKHAEGVGLTDLIYGVDEGRILYGVPGKAGKDLFLRIVGHTYQAAADARLMKTMTDHKIDYFSAWSYSSSMAYQGYPTVAYHVAKNYASFKDSRNLPLTKTSLLTEGAEADAVVAYDPATKTLRVMAYNFKDTLDYCDSLSVRFHLTVPDFCEKVVTVTESMIDDSVNYFDEWIKDRKEYGIGDDAFAWSPDDPGIDSPTTLADPAAREIYESKLRDRYVKISQLTPTTRTMTAGADGSFDWETVLAPHGVVFLEVKLAP